MQDEGSGVLQAIEQVANRCSNAIEKNLIHGELSIQNKTPEKAKQIFENDLQRIYCTEWLQCHPGSDICKRLESRVQISSFQKNVSSICCSRFERIMLALLLTLKEKYRKAKFFQGKYAARSTWTSQNSSSPTRWCSTATVFIIFFLLTWRGTWTPPF